MRQAVRDAFVGFTAPLEGVVPFMYLDVKGLVTTGIGNLIDPIEHALSLPFQNPDGTPASREEIAAEWTAVKARQDLRLRGGMIYRTVTTLRLPPAGIDQLVGGKLAQNDAHLRRRFPDWEEWPADAQLATHSMSWACGPAFRFPALEAALRAADFAGAASECHIDERGNAGIVPRNRANKAMYRTAAIVVARGLDRDVLHYPAELGDDAPPTEPDLDLVTVAGYQARLTEIAGLHGRADWDPRGVDGVHGRHTDAAVRAYQGARGLVVDGIVGPITRAALARETK